MARHYTRSHLYEKIFMLVVLFWIHSSRQVRYMLGKFQIIWNCITYMKIIVSRKKVENDSKYQIIDNLVMELKNENPNGCNILINHIHTNILFFQKY